MLVFEWKERDFIEKVNSRSFCWFPAAILVDQNGTPIWCLHTKLYKGAWNVSAYNSETVGHKKLRLRQIVYLLVLYNISFSWLLPLHGFQVIFLLRDSENDLFVSRQATWTIGVVLYCHFWSFLALLGQKRSTWNNSFRAREISRLRPKGVPFSGLRYMKG